MVSGGEVVVMVLVVTIDKVVVMVLVVAAGKESHQRGEEGGRRTGKLIELYILKYLALRN